MNPCLDKCRMNLYHLLYLLIKRITYAYVPKYLKELELLPQMASAILILQMFSLKGCGKKDIDQQYCQDVMIASGMYGLKYLPYSDS